VVYFIVGSAIIKGADLIFPYLNLPPWAVPLILFCTVLFFPIALILAWASVRAPSKKYPWLYVILIAIFTVIVDYFFLEYPKTDSNVPLSPTQSIDATKLKDDSTVTAPLQKTEKQDTSILEHKEDTIITFLEANKTIPAKTSPEKKTKAKEVWHDVMVQFDSLPPHVWENIRIGDEEYNENGQVTWEIEEVISINPRVIIHTYTITHPLERDKRGARIEAVKSNVECRIKLKVSRKKDALYYKNNQLFLNDTIRFRSARYSEIGRISGFLH